MYMEKREGGKNEGRGERSGEEVLHVELHVHVQERTSVTVAY